METQIKDLSNGTMFIIKQVMFQLLLLYTITYFQYEAHYDKALNKSTGAHLAALYDWKHF